MAIPELIHLIERKVIAGAIQPVLVAGGSLWARLQDGNGNAVTSTPVGAARALDVNIAAGAGAGGTSMIDDAVFGPGATAGTPAFGFYDSTRDTVDDGDAGALAMTAARALRVTVETPNADSAMDEVNDAVRVNIVAGAGAGGTSMIDDAVFTPAVTSITPMGAFADDVAPDSVNEGDAGAVRMSTRRELYVQIRDAAGNERGVNVDAAGAIAVGDGGGSLTVDQATHDNLNANVTLQVGDVDVSNGNPVPVSDAGGSLTVDDGGLAISVDDAAGSLTVDNPILSVVGGGLEATAQRVTLASDSTGLLSVDDNGGSLTVDQATHDNLNANANLQVGDADVQNANPVPVSDAGGSITVDDGGLTISVDDNAGSLTVDNAALSVTGGGAEATALRVTIANDSTGLVSVDDGGGALTVDGTILVTDIQDGAGDSVMDAVNDAIRVNIVAGAGSGGTAMTDDAAFTPATTSFTPVGGLADEVGPDSVDEGDGGAFRMSLNRNLYTQIRDGAGNERGAAVNASNQLAVSVDNGAAGAAVNIQDGGNSITVDNAALSVTGGGAEATALRVTVANDSTGVLSVDDNASSLTVDQATHDNLNANANLQVGDVDVANGNPVPVSDAGVSLTVDNAALSVTGGGAEATALRVTMANDSTGVLSVDDNAGSLTVDQATHGNLNANVTIQLNDVDVSTANPVPVAGTVAHDGVDSGNPVKIGAYAVETDGTDPGEVAEADRTDLKADMNGRLLVNAGHPNAWKTNNNYGAAQTNTQLKATPGANLSLYITGIILSCAGACNITLVSDTAGAATAEFGPYYFAANGGLVAQNITPAVRIAANTNFGITSSAAVNHSVTIIGYIAP